MTDAPQRGLLTQIFISPDEPRLRAGWRLLIHLLLILFFAVLVFLIIGVAYLVISQFMSLDISQISQEGISAFLASIVIEVTVFTAATWIARRFLDRRSFASLGLHLNRFALPDLVFGILLGGLLMGLIYAFESLMGWIDFEQFAWQSATSASSVIIQVALWFILYIGVGYAEELLSRGYHLQNLWAGLNMPLALVLSSAVFAVMHAANPNASAVSTLGIFFAGFFLAYGYLRTSELWIPIGLHIGWNFFQGTVFGFEVSGQEGFHLIQHTVTGPEIITGGAFGPEAGMVSWVAMLLGTALTWLYTRNRPKPNPKAKPEPASPLLHPTP